VNVKPDGRVVPVAVIVGVGAPVVLKTNDPIWLRVKYAVPVPVTVLMVGASAWFTVMTRFSVDALSSVTLVAVTAIGYCAAKVGTPVRVAVPLPLSANVIPGGSVPVSVIAAAGYPVVVTVYVPGNVVVKVAVGALVMEGASSLFSVKL
jgi:hypothetical protein